MKSHKMKETIKRGFFIRQDERAVKKVKVFHTPSPVLGLHNHQEEKVAEASVGLL